jgi:hypothetical protein
LTLEEGYSEMLFITVLRPSLILASVSRKSSRYGGKRGGGEALKLNEYLLSNVLYSKEAMYLYHELSVLTMCGYRVWKPPKEGLQYAGERPKVK